MQRGRRHPMCQGHGGRVGKEKLGEEAKVVVETELLKRGPAGTGQHEHENVLR